MQVEYGKFFKKLIVRTKIVVLLAAALDLTRDLHLTSRGVAMNFFSHPLLTLCFLISTVRLYAKGWTGS